MAGGAFLLKPLLPLLSSDAHAWALRLSDDRLRLSGVSRISASEVDPESLPDGLRGAMRGGLRGVRSAEAPPGATYGEPLIRRLREIDVEIGKVLRMDRAPLLLAGDPFYFAPYRQASVYPHLLEDTLGGGPGGPRAEEMHRQAWGVLGPYFDHAVREALAVYSASGGTGEASNDPAEVALAARNGRVAVLFVPLSAARWGKVEAWKDRVEIHSPARPGDQDLYDVSIAYTLLSSGSVYVRPESLMPEGVTIAAVFRDEHVHPDIETSAEGRAGAVGR